MFLLEKGTLKAWQMYLSQLRSTNDVKRLFDLLDELEKRPELERQFVSVTAALLDLLKKGEIKDYEMIKKVSECPMIGFSGKSKKQLDSTWRAAYPTILRTLFDHDHKVMLHYWLRSYEQVGVVRETLGLLATCYHEEQLEALENVLIPALSQLSRDDQRKIVPQALNRKIQRCESEEAVTICRLARGIIGQKTNTLIFFIQHENFDKARELLNEEKSEEELWQQYVAELIKDHQYLQALAIIGDKKDIFQDDPNIRNHLVQISSDENFQSSEAAMWDLISAFQLYGIDSAGIFRFALKHSRRQHIHQFIFDSLVQEMFVLKKERELDLFFAATDALSKNHPEHLATLLNNRAVIESMFEQDCLHQYIKIVLTCLETLGCKKQKDVLMTLSDLNKRFQNIVFSDFSSRFIQLSFNCSGALSLGFKASKWRLEHLPIDFEILVLIISKLLTLDNLSKTELVLLMQACSFLFKKIDGTNWMISVPQGIDGEQLFALMSREFSRHLVTEKTTENTKTILIERAFPLDVDYWTWFWLFLRPALEHSAGANKDFVTEATKFLVRTFVHFEGEYFEIFVEELLTTAKCQRFHWDIFIDVLHHLSDSLKQYEAIFYWASHVQSSYVLWKNQIDTAYQMKFAVTAFTSMSSQFEKTNDYYQLMSGFETLESLCYQDSPLLIQSAFLHLLLSFHQKLIYRVMSGHVDEIDNYDAAHSFVSEKLRDYIPEYLSSFSKRVSTVHEHYRFRFWDMVWPCFVKIIKFDDAWTESVLMAFRNSRGEYEKSMSSLSEMCRCQLLNVLFHAACGLSTDNSHRHEFIDELEALFKVETDEKIKWRYAAILLDFIKSSPGKELNDTMMNFKSKMFARVHHWLMDMLAEHRRLKLPPSETKLVVLVSFTGFFGAAYKGFLPLSEPSSVTVFDAIKKAIPKSWERTFVHFLAKDHPEILLTTRISCFNFLKDNAKFLSLFNVLRKRFFNELNLYPRSTYCDEFIQINEILSRALRDGVSSVWSSVDLFGTCFMDHLELLTIVSKRYLTRVSHQVLFCEKIGLDSSFDQDSWISSKFWNIEAAKSKMELRGEGLKILNSSLEILHYAIIGMSFFSKEKAHDMHVRSIQFLNLFSDSMSLAMILETKFISLIVNMSMTHSCKELGDQYYHLLCHILNRAVRLDAQKKPDGKIPLFTTVLLNLITCDIDRFVLQRYPLCDETNAKKRVVNFIKWAFLVFLTRDFTEKTDVIKEVLGISPHEEIRVLATTKKIVKVN